MTLFDWKREQSVARRDKGTARVEANNVDWVREARAFAVRHAGLYDRVTADDVRSWADRTGKHPTHPNAYGAVFRGKQFVHLGFEASTTPSRHAGTVRVWGVK